MAEERNVFNATSLICTLEFQPHIDEDFMVDGPKHRQRHTQAHTGTDRHRHAQIHTHIYTK